MPELKPVEPTVASLTVEVEQLKHDNARMYTEMCGYVAQVEEARVDVAALVEALRSARYWMQTPTNELLRAKFATDLGRIDALIAEGSRNGAAVIQRPATCAHPISCGWHTVKTDPPSNLWACCHYDCPNSIKAFGGSHG